MTSMLSRCPSAVVLGAGNVLLQDEGLGVHALRRLGERYRLPPEVELVDGGVRGLELLPLLEGVPNLLIVDAVATGQPAGTLRRVDGPDIPAALALKMSMHQVGLQELLGVCRLRGTLPDRMVLWGMQPAAIGWGLDLSAPVVAGLDGLADAVACELSAWGLALRATPAGSGGPRSYWPV